LREILCELISQRLSTVTTDQIDEQSARHQGLAIDLIVAFARV
jgi:hypothetical protein